MRIYSRAADAMEQTYAAWRAFMEERNIPVPDWETLSAHVAVDSQLTDTLLQENPLRLAEEPLLIDGGFTARELRMIMGTTDVVNQFFESEEFVPENMRADYRRLAEMYRGVYRDMANMMRVGSWMRSLRQQDPARELLSRRNTNGMTQAEAQFYNLYKANSIGVLETNELNDAQILNRYSMLITARDVLRYALGGRWLRGGNPEELLNRENPNAGGILRGFAPRSTGGDRLAGPLTYALAQRGGIDPESLVEFVEELRAAIVRERGENLGQPVREIESPDQEAAAYLTAWREGSRCSEAVMRLAAWRAGDAESIVRFARALTEGPEGGDLSSDAGRRPWELAEDLPESARETLIANFDKTFGKYFSQDQMSDGSAFSRIRAGGASMSDLIQKYGGDPSQAERMAKIELMARVLAGDAVSVERVLSDGTSVRVPLRLEAGQPVFREAVENAARIRRDLDRMREEFSRQTPAQRQSGVRRIIEELYGTGHPGTPDPDQRNAEAEIRGRMHRDAGEALAREGIFEPEVSSALGGRQTAQLYRAARELSVYRASLPADRAAEYDRYLLILRNCAEGLDRIRSDQELLRTDPALQTAEFAGGSADRRLSGWLLDGNLLEREAETLYRAGTALAQVLRYGMGEGASADADRILNGAGGHALAEILGAESGSVRQLREMTDRLRQEIPTDRSRFAEAEAIPMELVAAGGEIVSRFRPQTPGRAPESLRPWEREINLARLGTEARQYAAQNFDTAMGPLFGQEERERLAARGMDIYDRIFVNGQSLSDLYRQTPERRPYEQMESDMKCRLLENVLAGRRIDVMVEDAAGRTALKRLLPYDSSGLIQTAMGPDADGITIPRSARYAAAGQEEEDRIRSAAEESRVRLENALRSPAALQNRKEAIRYGHGDNAVNAAYNAAARRFDPGRPDMTEAYIGGGTGAGDLLRQYAGFGGSDAEAGRMLSSLAQMHLLSQNPGIHLMDLVDPDRFQEGKQAAGKAVTDALRKGLEGRGWEDYDEIIAGVVQMVSPAAEQGLPARLRDVRPLDLRQELAVVMGLDLNRRPPYSQAEFLRNMDSPENSPRVSAMLAFAGQIAGDAARLGRLRMADPAFAEAGGPALSGNDRMAAFDALQALGNAEGRWLNAARDYQRLEAVDNSEEVTAAAGVRANSAEMTAAAGVRVNSEEMTAAAGVRASSAEMTAAVGVRMNSEEITAAAGVRMNLENVRQILAAGGSLQAHAGDIRQALDVRHRAYYREASRRQTPRLRDMVERPYGELGLNGSALAVNVSIELPLQQRRMKELDRLVSLADGKRELPPETDGYVAAYASDVFDRMFVRGADPVFGLDRVMRMAADGLDMMDRIYIDGRSLRDRYGEKYSGLPREEAAARMKTEFVVQMLRGARIDVTAERNGVEVLSALAVRTEIRRINQRAWLTVPDSAASSGRFIDPAETENGFAVPPMSRETAGRIYASQWSALERTGRAAGGPAAAPAAEQPGPEAQQVQNRRNEERSRRSEEWLAEDRRTGEILDSAAQRMNISSDAHEAGGADLRDELFLLYANGEERLRDIFKAGRAATSEDSMMMNAAEGWLSLVIDQATYAGDSAHRPETGMTVPTRLQRLMGYGPGNLSSMFFIDGMSVDDYALAHGLQDGLRGENPEYNRKVILAAALLGGEHHVDMIRTGRAPDGTYKTGVMEIQMDLSPFDGMVGFFQTRPSRKANRLYGDTSGRSERHEKIKLAADAKLLQALSGELLDEEVAERRELREAADRDRVSRWRAAYPQTAPGQEQPAAPAQERERSAAPGSEQPAAPATEQERSAAPGSEQPAAPATEQERSAAPGSEQPAAPATEQERSAAPGSEEPAAPASEQEQPATPASERQQDTSVRRRIGLDGVMAGSGESGMIRNEDSDAAMNGPAENGRTEERERKSDQSVSMEQEQETEPSQNEHRRRSTDVQQEIRNGAGRLPARSPSGERKPPEGKRFEEKSPQEEQLGDRKPPAKKSTPAGPKK